MRIKIVRWFEVALMMAALAAVVLTFAMLKQTPAAAQSSLEAQVQELLDKEAIRTLLVTYGRMLDSRDLEGYSRLFAREGTWSGGIGTAKGPENIRKMLENAFKNSPPYDPEHVRSFHLMTNFLIDVDGDRATAWSKWTFFTRTEDDKLSPTLSGHYNDVLIREDGEWKFLSRVAPHDIP